MYRAVRLKIEKTYLDEIVEFYSEAYEPHDCYLLAYTFFHNFNYRINCN